MVDRILDILLKVPRKADLKDKEEEKSINNSIKYLRRIILTHTLPNLHITRFYILCDGLVSEQICYSFSLNQIILPYKVCKRKSMKANVVTILTLDLLKYSPVM